MALKWHSNLMIKEVLSESDSIATLVERVTPTTFFAFFCPKPRVRGSSSPETQKVSIYSESPRELSVHLF